MNEHENNSIQCACRFLDQCSFVLNQRDKMPELVKRIMANYCTREGSDCARRRVYEKLGPDTAPELMLPDQFEWAGHYIEEYVPHTKSLASTGPE